MIDGAGTNHFVTLMIFMNYLLEIIIRHLINHSNILHTNIMHYQISFCNTDDIYELQLYSKNRFVTFKSTYFPRGEEGTAIYAI